MLNKGQTAVPLITVDPYFSIWSFSDNLYDDVTRHWSGIRAAMTGVIEVDGIFYRFMGCVNGDGRFYFGEPECVQQKSVNILPTKTEYVFENDLFVLTLDFRTPLLADDLKLLSTPVSYISYKVVFKDGNRHKVKMYFDIYSEICSENASDDITFEIKDKYISCGKGEKDVLKRSDDISLIEWGNLYLSFPGATYRAMNTKSRWEQFYWHDTPKKIANVMKICDNAPAISALKEYEENEISDFLCIAYDDIYSIEYFGEKLPAYWKRDGDTIDDVIEQAISRYDEINRRCDKFDTELYNRACEISEKYAHLVSLAYRQAIAAHKLCEKDGKLLFFSKECSSNGCIGTVDVTYPSIPMFLIFNPDLAEGMLNPVFEFAEGEHGWEHLFAPHDVGQYPIANGQMYHIMRRELGLEGEQMPVEECGNMLLCTAALCAVRKDWAYAEKHKKLLGQWADYLVECGYDMTEQLCTDDFAGHSEHNANLAIKGILGIAVWGDMLNRIGKNGEEYINKAREYAKEWKKSTYSNDHYSLIYDNKDTWSIKYNIVWDKILGLDIFDKDIFETEVKYYKTKMNKYGLPLDSRADYTKSDWQMWSVCMTKDTQYRDMIIDRMFEAMSDMLPKGPMPDWYNTSIAKKESFQGRSVQGGLFLPMLKIQIN